MSIFTRRSSTLAAALSRSTARRPPSRRQPTAFSKEDALLNFITRRRLIGGFAPAIAALSIMGGVASAHAATTKHRHPTPAVAKRIVSRAHASSSSDAQLEASVGTTTLQSFPWYAGGGSCTANGSAVWYRAYNAITVNGWAHSSAPFRACRAQVHVRYYADPDGNYLLGETVVAIPTACSTTDPTCFSTEAVGISFYNALPGYFFLNFTKAQVADHITVAVESR
jgi:hypothetical protein